MWSAVFADKFPALFEYSVVGWYGEEGGNHTKTFLKFRNYDFEFMELMKEMWKTFWE